MIVKLTFTVGNGKHTSTWYVFNKPLPLVRGPDRRESLRAFSLPRDPILHTDGETLWGWDLYAVLLIWGNEKRAIARRRYSSSLSLSLSPISFIWYLPVGFKWTISDGSVCWWCVRTWFFSFYPLYSRHLSVAGLSEDQYNFFFFFYTYFKPIHFFKTLYFIFFYFLFIFRSLNLQKIYLSLGHGYFIATLK